MRTKFLMLYLVIFSILAPFAIAAKVHGTIYSPYLEKLDNTIVEVNTQPKQTIVSADGAYSFNLPKGDYVIAAKYTDGDKYSIKENITITTEGDFNLDLILFPDFSEDEEIAADEVSIPEFIGVSSVWTYVLIAWVIVVVVIIYMMRSAKKLGVDLDEESDNIIKFIKESGGRITQKDIRKKFPWSEAKISLIIADLEDKKVIKKIKKGRTNIIILER